MNQETGTESSESDILRSLYQWIITGTAERSKEKLRFRALGSPLAAKRMKPSGSVPPETHLAGWVPVG